MLFIVKSCLNNTMNASLYCGSDLNSIVWFKEQGGFDLREQRVEMKQTEHLTYE